MTGLAKLLSSRRKDLLRQFEERARVSPPSEEVPRPQLLDMIPGLLDAVRRSLHDLAEGRENLAGPGPESQVSEEHEAPRFPPGITLDRLVFEYGLLRECILDLVAEASDTVDVQELRVLDRCLDAALRDTVRRYESQRNTENEAREKQWLVDEEIRLVALTDLRLPLNTICLMAEALRRSQNLPERGQKSAQSIRQKADFIHQVVANLLELSWLRRDRGVDLSANSFGLTRLSAEVLENLQETFPEQPFRLEERGYLPERWDSRRFSLLLDTLVRLARAHSPTGTPMTIVLNTEGDRIRIDAGNVGAPLLATPLSRLADLPKGMPAYHSLDGMPGLKLYLAQQITSAYGGTIEVRALVKEGTVFTVWLPRGKTGSRPPA